MCCCIRNLGRIGVIASLVLSCSAYAADADNYAPLYVEGRDSLSLPVRDRALGPFYEHDVSGTYETFAKIRPFYAEGFDSRTDNGWDCILYPAYTYRDFPGGNRWAVFELINGSESVSEGRDPIKTFEIWPFYWHYDNGVRAESYDAVFPIAGTLRNRMFYKRIDWFAFPAFVRLEQPDHVDTCILWPIFRHREGPQSSGFGVWPIAGHFEKTGAYNRTYFIWPLGYNNHKTQPQAIGGGDLHQFGILPLYASETAPGLVSRTVIWPLFGYTKAEAPRPNYHEVRFFYPFGVEGRGDNVYVNRLLPFYAHETHPGYDKHWYAWPIYRHVNSRVESVDVSKTSILYFVFSNELQTATGTDFEARKTQLWPLFGYSDNGKGSRQFQFLNPFEPLYGGNEQIRQSWAPFFAVYRFEERGDELRRSVLWDFVLYERAADKSDFSIGPLFDRKKSANGSSWSVVKGLLGRETTDGVSRWKVLWGIFGRKGGK